MVDKKHASVLTFVHTAVFDILRGKAGAREFVFSEPLVFLESCAVHNLISYPTFIALSQIVAMHEAACNKRTVPAAAASYAYLPKQPTYEYSSKQSHAHKMGEVTESQA